MSGVSARYAAHSNCHAGPSARPRDTGSLRARDCLPLRPHDMRFLLHRALPLEPWPSIFVARPRAPNPRACHFEPAITQLSPSFVKIYNQAFTGEVSGLDEIAGVGFRKEYRDKFWRKGKSVDYSHEREWRVPHDLDFELEHVEFVIVASYSDMARAPKQLKDGIGRDKWLIMDNYARIEHLWPVHRLPE
jgi:hypothetical protein